MYCLCLLRHFKFKALKQRSWVSEPCSKHPNPHKELQCASSQRWAGAPWPPKKQIMIQWFIWFMSSIHLLWFDVIYSSTCGASSVARRPGKAESHYSSRNPNDLNHRLDSRRDLTHHSCIVLSSALDACWPHPQRCKYQDRRSCW